MDVNIIRIQSPGVMEFGPCDVRKGRLQCVSFAEGTFVFVFANYFFFFSKNNNFFLGGSFTVNKKNKVRKSLFFIGRGGPKSRPCYSNRKREGFLANFIPISDLKRKVIIDNELRESKEYVAVRTLPNILFNEIKLVHKFQYFDTRFWIIYDYNLKWIK